MRTHLSRTVLRQALTAVCVAIGLGVTSAQAQTRPGNQADPLAAVAAPGQQPRPTDTQAMADLASSLRSGRRVEVVTRDGRTVVGRLTHASGAGLVLDVPTGLRGASPVEFETDSIREVTEWRPDPIWDGAGVGAITALLGSVAVGLLIAAGDDGPDDWSGFAEFVGKGSLIGAGIGAAADLLVERRVVVFRAQARGISVTPILAQRQKGVVVTWRF